MTCPHSVTCSQCSSPGLHIACTQPTSETWGLAPARQARICAPIAARIAVLVEIYAPSRLLLTVGVRLASEQGAAGPPPSASFPLPGRPLFYGV